MDQLINRGYQVIKATNENSTQRYGTGGFGGRLRGHLRFWQHTLWPGWQVGAEPRGSSASHGRGAATVVVSLAAVGSTAMCNQYNN